MTHACESLALRLYGPERTEVLAARDNLSALTTAELRGLAAAWDVAVGCWAIDVGAEGWHGQCFRRREERRSNMRVVKLGFFWGVEVDAPDEGGPLLYGAGAVASADGSVPQGLLEKWYPVAGLGAITVSEPAGHRGRLLLGVWVAICGDLLPEHRGAEDISGETIRAEALMGRERGQIAMALWEKFAAWVEAQPAQWTPPAPSLWIVPVAT